MSSEGATSKKMLDTQQGSALVEELLDATLLVQPSFVRLDGFEDSTKVLIRRDYEALKASGKVAIVSGGGSGHEPAMAGYVGEGMLTAGVCGDVFASPTIKAVLAAILTVTGPGGCLLIVMNYTGDRINFGIAAEEAKLRYGLQVEMVIVGDDVALKDAQHPRGIAGTVLVHKAAGALAQSGLPLSKVADGAAAVAGAVKSMGAAITACSLPGQPPSSRLGPGEIEIGLGIHGEPGAFKSPMLTTTAIIGKLFEFVCEAAAMGSGDQCVLLVNNLGATTPMEMTLATAAAVRECTKRGIVIAGLSSGTLMSSLDMLGVSVSLLKVDEPTLALLMAPTSAPAWLPLTKIDNGTAPQVVPMPKIDQVTLSAPPAELDGPATMLKKCIQAACEAVVAAEGELTAADTKVGDGDCGETLKRGALRVLDEVGGWPLTSAHGTLVGVSMAIENSMGGSSGVLYLLGLKAAANALPREGSADRVAWVNAFVAFVEAVVKYGGASVGSRTMCDALIPAAEVLRKGGTLEAAVGAASEGAMATKGMTAALGRSAYVPAENQSGVEDPGAMAVRIWMAAALKASSA